MAVSGPDTAPARFDRVSIALHWLVAVLVFVAVVFALVAVSIQERDINDPAIAPLVTIHRSLGTTIFVLTVINLIWRATHRQPALPATLPKMQRMVARAVHAQLFALLAIMPLTGWIDAAAFDQPVDYFFIGKLPLMFAVPKPVGEAAFAVHLAARFLLYPLVVLHTAAALYHHYGARNDILRRMLPRS